MSSLLSVPAIDVTYQVDMSVQTAQGNFNPATDRVLVSGTFTNWTTTSYLAPSPGNTNIYVGTFSQTQAVAQIENHKFIIDAGGTGSTLNWESIGNRFFQIPAADTNLPVVYFNDATSAPVTISVTFQVDMSIQISQGIFNPGAGDSVSVAGDAINNWTAGASMLAQSSSNTNLWVGAFSLNDNPGATVNYKFVITTGSGTTWEHDGLGPNGVQNRQFIFPNADTNLPVVFFNNITNSFVAEPVTFTLNTAVLNAFGTFDPSSGTVNLAGDPINNWNSSATPLTQTPTNANLWVTTVTISNAPGSAVQYKFIVNGTWENNGLGPNGAMNREFTFTASPTILPRAFYNDISNLGAITNSLAADGTLSLTWAPGPNIRLQSSSSLAGAWSDVNNTQGQGSATITNSVPKQFFRLIGP